ncbi:hypothetical protein Bpfe_011213, partial [Biomphalaria pfeifferi]
IQVCPNCSIRNPTCLVNRPCRHVTNCVRCKHQTSECGDCGRTIDIFQTESDLDRQETYRQ